ncbi:MAG TPA: hypothetical protein DDZ54_04650, partial [Erythrobacter sp.]|nr:hypothetical protein [Erythrobacter sp.]
MPAISVSSSSPHEPKEHNMMSRRNVLAGAAVAGGAMAAGTG